MQRQLTFKIIIIFVLGILLLIPTLMIQGLVRERMNLRDDVIKDIAKSSANRQTLVGPLVAVPYTKTTLVWSNDARFQKEETKSGMLYFLPKTFTLNGNLNVDRRYRGIYEARLYNAVNNITGSFSLPKNFGIKTDINDYKFGQPFIAIGVSDVRGVNNDLKLTVNGQSLVVSPGTGGSKLGSGIHGLLSTDKLQNGIDFTYDIDINLQGTSGFTIVPVGLKTDVTLKSNWPHPSFMGDFLPISRTVNSGGFLSKWQTNSFASDVQEKLRACVNDNYCKQFNSANFRVDLIDPVDQYLKTDRAIKYAFLFIALTFAGFFLFEVIKRLAIHPIQYSFVGISLAMFFLLLLSLSEHLGFVLAYVCSAVACVALIGFYVAGVLKNKQQGIGFTVILAAVYLMLYVLLNAEDYSLLMGSIFVFGLLAGAMVATRKLDWYKIATINQSKEERSDD